MPPKRSGPHLPLAALLLAASVPAMDGADLTWVKVALLTLSGVALVVWAVAFGRERSRRAAAAAETGTETGTETDGGQTAGTDPAPTASGTAPNG